MRFTSQRLKANIVGFVVILLLGLLFWLAGWDVREYTFQTGLIAAMVQGTNLMKTNTNGKKIQRGVDPGGEK